MKSFWPLPDLNPGWIVGSPGLDHFFLDSWLGNCILLDPERVNLESCQIED